MSLRNTSTTGGVVYQEIPGASYDNSSAGILDFSAPQTGEYTLYVIGGATGPYTFESTIFNGDNPGVKNDITGTIAKGQVLVYSQDYDASAPTSVLNYETSTDSIANITAAPPNNIPLPASPVR